MKLNTLVTHTRTIDTEIERKGRGDHQARATRNRSVAQEGTCATEGGLQPRWASPLRVSVRKEKSPEGGSACPAWLFHDGVRGVCPPLPLAPSILLRLLLEPL